MLMLGIFIKEAQNKDASDILKINNAAINAVHSFLYSEDTKKAWALKNEDEASNLLTSDKYHSVIALYNGKIAGFGTSTRNSLRLLYVHPDYQSKGIGSAILRNLEKRISTPTSLKVSKNSVAFFQKHGYKVQGKSKIILSGRSIETFLINKN